jgi:hypothetical protein
MLNKKESHHIQLTFREQASIARIWCHHYKSTLFAVGEGNYSAVSAVVVKLLFAVNTDGQQYQGIST